MGAFLRGVQVGSFNVGTKERGGIGYLARGQRGKDLVKMSVTVKHGVYCIISWNEDMTSGSEVSWSGMFKPLCLGVDHYMFMLRKHNHESVKRGRASGQETCSNLLEFVALYGRYRSIEPCHALSRVVPRKVIHLCRISLLIVKVREMKAIGAIGVQLEKARRNDTVLQIYSLAPNVPFSFQDKPSLIGDNEVVFDELAIEDVSTICEEGEPA